MHSQSIPLYILDKEERTYQSYLEHDSWHYWQTSSDIQQAHSFWVPVQVWSKSWTWNWIGSSDIWRDWGEKAKIAEHFVYLYYQQQIYSYEQQFSISAWGLYQHNCLREEYKGNTIILHIESKQAPKYCPSAVIPIAESTDKCKNRQSFWCTQLLRFQTFVFVRGDGWYIAAPSPSFSIHRPLLWGGNDRKHFFESATAANRRHSLNARASRASGGFRFFAFTSSPHGCNPLETNTLRVKASPFTENPLSSYHSIT